MTPYFNELLYLCSALVYTVVICQYFNVFSVFAAKKAKMTKSADLLSIVLQHGVNAEGQLYRLKRGTKLRLVPAPCLLGKSVALYCNYPVTGEYFIFIICKFLLRLMYKSNGKNDVIYFQKKPNSYVLNICT